MRICTENRTAINTHGDAIFSYRTENRTPIRYATIRLPFMGNRIRVDVPKT
jgi:hypothetical protein